MSESQEIQAEEFVASFAGSETGPQADVEFDFVADDGAPEVGDGDASQSATSPLWRDVNFGVSPAGTPLWADKIKLEHVLRIQCSRSVPERGGDSRGAWFGAVDRTAELCQGSGPWLSQGG